MKVSTIAGVLILAFGLTTLVSNHSSAADQKNKVIEAKAKKSRGTGADDNIKGKSDSCGINAMDVTATPPPGKGGDKSRGLYCAVHVDNRTRWYVKIYVDGNYRGTVAPYGDIYPAAIAGSTSVYARADFTDGTYKYWGPNSFNCEEDTIYAWRLGE